MLYGGMKQFFILTICLLAANFSKAQTSGQLDSFVRVVSAKLG